MSDAGDSSLKRSLDHDFDGDLPSESHKRSRHSENDSATDVHQNDNDTVAGDDEAGGRRRYGDDIASSSSSGGSGGGSGGNRRMHTNIQGAEGVLDQPGTAIDLNVFVGEIRLLVHNNDVGAIIGKQGATMRRIRDESGCLALHIEGKSKPERGNERKAPDDDSQNRIMYVRGNAASIARAVGMSWQMIAETAKNSAMEIAATTGGAAATNASTTGELPDVTVNLLVHRGYSGLLLGRQGATIKAMMNETGTKLKLESDCLRHSTEKRLAITGSFQRLSDAVLRIVTMIFRSTVRPGTLSIPYSPDTPFFSYDEKRGVPIVAPPPAAAGAAPFYPYAPPVPAPPPHEMPYGYPPSYPPPSAYAPNPPHPSAYGYPPAAPYGPSSPHTQPHSHSGGGNSPSQRRSRSPTAHYSRSTNSSSNNRSSSSGAPEVVQKVAIPSVCAGLVIGKSGANIKVIRDQSRCTVKLEDTNPSNPSERIVTITGTKEDIQLAIQLITEQVEKYKPPQ